MENVVELAFLTCHGECAYCQKLVASRLLEHNGERGKYKSDVQLNLIVAAATICELLPNMKITKCIIFCLYCILCLTSLTTYLHVTI